MRCHPFEIKKEYCIYTATAKILIYKSIPNGNQNERNLKKLLFNYGCFVFLFYYLAQNRPTKNSIATKKTHRKSKRIINITLFGKNRVIKHTEIRTHTNGTKDGKKERETLEYIIFSNKKLREEEEKRW